MLSAIRGPLLSLVVSLLTTTLAANERDEGALTSPRLPRESASAPSAAASAAPTEMPPRIQEKPARRGATDDARNGTTATQPPRDCPRFVLAASSERRRLENTELVEASGLVASRRNPGVLFSHNDSGGAPKVFAFTISGVDLGTFTLSRAGLIDWEDLAIGPGPAPAKSYLYVGDLGQNGGKRRIVSVYRLEEPEVALAPGQKPVARQVSKVERLDLAYPKSMEDDSEALFVDPHAADLYILTKARSGPTRVFRARAPLSAERPNALTLVADLEWFAPPSFGSLVTSASISEDGSQILVRTYYQAYLFRRSPNQSIIDALRQRPCRVPIQFEPQGEAIAFLAGGGYVTVSEGRQPYLHLFEPAE